MVLSSLVSGGIKVCKSKGYNSIIVIGHPDYHPRFGFKSASAKSLESPVPVLDEASWFLSWSPDPWMVLLVK